MEIFADISARDRVSNDPFDSSRTAARRQAHPGSPRRRGENAAPRHARPA
ncbi:hypothetical protein BPC006_II2265 [Burkholderia pseudomallei BPC006]|nr:hypothetical protein BPC006_II2265 [Burkholderia pseudomallei BPC006]